MNASTRLLRALLERGDYLDGWATDELQKLLPILERANSDVLGKLAATKGEGTRAWLADMKADIDEIYTAAVDEVEGRLMPDLKNLAQGELAWGADALGGVVAGVSVTAPGATLLWSAIVSLPVASGYSLDQLLKAMRIDAPSKIIEAIQLGMVEGETVDQVVRRVRGEVVQRARWVKSEDGKKHYIPGVYKGGAMDGATTRSAEMLVRTATAHVGNQAREALYRENEDIIKGYQRVETLDLSTCIPCGIEDSRVYGIDEPRPQLPAHISCRGVWVPVLKSLRELGLDADDFPPSTRASMDGQVPEYTTWADKVAKASKDRRIAMLGKARADLYERGVPLADMVREGKQVPLKDLHVPKEKRGAA